MKLTAKQLNRYIILKLPAAFLCGVRVMRLCATECITTVTYRWINQNPFKSIYFAVLAMAAELSTGALLWFCIGQTKKQFSTLVVGMNAKFYKKAVGKIVFTCTDTFLLNTTVNKAMQTGEGEIFVLVADGKNQEGELIATFEFTWSIKLKSTLS